MSDENISAGQKRRIAIDDDFSNSTSPEPITKKNRSDSSKMDGTGIESVFQLVITNLPGGWTCEQVMNYVREEIGENALLVNDFRDTDSDFQIRLKFKTEEQRNIVLEKLKLKQALGLVCVDTEDLVSDEESCKSDVRSENRNVKGQDVGMNISIDVWDVDPKTLYGLKEAYLASLDITPPLSNWVLVTNFRCDRSELKEVLELAGHVTVCHVVTVAKKYANVMYSHPLEAVQAISMLNGQTYYGQSLKITMDHQSEYWKILPKGLANLGPGLGKYGKPVRNVAKEYERFISGKSTLIETKIFKSEKSTDLLKEHILPIISRPEMDETPKLVIDTQNIEDEVKAESPKEEIESEINTPDLDTSQKLDSEDTSKVNSSEKESTNGTHTTADNHNNLDTSSFNKPITNFGQNSGTNGEMVRPFNDTQFGVNQRPAGFLGMQSIQGMQGPQAMQGMQRPQAMQGMQGPQAMQGMQRPLAMQGMQGPQAMQGMQISQVMQGMQGPQAIQGMQGPQAMQGMQGMLGNQSMQGMQGMQVSQAMQGIQGMQGMPMMQNMQRPMQNPFNQGQFGNQGFNNQPSQFYNQMPSNGYLNNGIQGNMQAPVVQPNIPTRPVGPFAQQQSVRPLEIYRGMNAFTLKIINIPNGVKLSALCDKLSQFGHVTGLELAGPTAAVVKYQSAGDAERCFRNYRQVFQY